MPENRLATRGAPPVWLAAILSQAIGVFAGAASYALWPHDRGENLDIALSAMAAGLCASTVGHLVFRMPGWWIIINAAFLPALWLGFGSDWPGWVFGALFLATLLVFWNVARERVPLYLSNEITARAIANLFGEGIVPASRRDAVQFCDLGSGPGGLCLRLGDMRPDWRYTGYESAPILFLVSAIRAKLRRSHNVRFVGRDFWAEDLSRFDIVYAFLSPAPMARLYAKARAEMSPGSIFVSNSFEVPGEMPDEVLELTDSRRTKLLIWRL